MTSRISSIFASNIAGGKKALVTYIVAGDPDLAASQEILESLPEAGADIIELGIPFTDPMADGPVIQDAALRALANGMTIAKLFQMVRDFRIKNDTTPIVLMGYFNSVFAYGAEKFALDAKSAGVDGLLIVDLPSEEEDELVIPCKEHGLDFIRLATPTTDVKRLPSVLKNASGFLYYVAVAGITGTTSASADNLKPALDEIRKHTKLPICVGFGIKTPEDAKAMAEIADGVVVGSALVDLISKKADHSAFIKSLKSSIM
ncbi:MAG: tryptophan synthase subunit alpha [Micavibrio aeruginosavorus]|uniref:Tryptophan synthase alpha chain n=1 Tax=Micavibrio aeruginosavorus TaxID=349221 RepID=A0A2W5HPH6_9BACT|nr:MAG: tryptophan synthase subunit alpha [Micavibrio aeruginosavorus]